MAEVSIVGVDQSEPSDALLGAHLDSPIAGTECDVLVVRLIGWAVGRASPVVRVQVLDTGGRVIHEAVNDLPQPHVALRYPDTPPGPPRPVSTFCSAPSGSRRSSSCSSTACWGTDDSSVQAKHDPFAAREKQIEGKILVLNIRRLPAWMLSHAQHEARDGIYPTYRPTPIPTADEIAERTLADDSLNYFTSTGRFSVERWLRAEQLADDFLNFIGGFTDVSEENDRRVRDTGMINTIPYDHEVRHWFNDVQIVRMYEQNPLWASIEQKVYSGEWGDEERTSTLQRSDTWESIR